MTLALIDRIDITFGVLADLNVFACVHLFPAVIGTGVCIPGIVDCPGQGSAIGEHVVDDMCSFDGLLKQQQKVAFALLMPGYHLIQPRDVGLVELMEDVLTLHMTILITQ